MVEPTTKVQVISDITRLLEITPEKMREISDEFKETVDDNMSISDMVIACRDYDHTAFIIGALVSTTILELTQNMQVQKLAEINRLSGDGMEVM